MRFWRPGPSELNRRGIRLGPTAGVSTETELKASTVRRTAGARPVVDEIVANFNTMDPIPTRVASPGRKDTACRPALALMRSGALTNDAQPG